MQKKLELARIEELEIEALTDEELEIIQSAGAFTTAASCECCITGMTVGGPSKPPPDV